MSSETEKVAKDLLMPRQFLKGSLCPKQNAPSQNKAELNSRDFVPWDMDMSRFNPTPQNDNDNGGHSDNQNKMMTIMMTVMMTVMMIMVRMLIY